jgi:Fic family protein
MNKDKERQRATAEFERALKEHFESLSAKKCDLYSVREELKDALALVDETNVPLDSKVIRETCERITATCKAMWSFAEAIQEDLRKRSSEGYDIDDCSLGFYLSEIWLSENATGDTYEICGSWESLEDCIARVKEVFSETKVERCVELANQIFHTRLVCKKYFESGSEWPSITEEMIADIHQTLLLHHGAPTGYRTSHSSNDLGLRYLHFERIAECLTVLLKFVNEKMTKDDKLQNRLLLGTLFFERFLWIHPFAEGNGRTARILF